MLTFGLLAVVFAPGAMRHTPTLHEPRMLTAAVLAPTTSDLATVATVPRVGRAISSLALLVGVLAMIAMAVPVRRRRSPRPGSAQPPVAGGSGRTRRRGPPVFA